MRSILLLASIVTLSSWNSVARADSPIGPCRAWAELFGETLDEELAAAPSADELPRPLRPDEITRAIPLPTPDDLDDFPAPPRPGEITPAVPLPTPDDLARAFPAPPTRDEITRAVPLPTPDDLRGFPAPPRPDEITPAVPLPAPEDLDNLPPWWL